MTTLEPCARCGGRPLVDNPNPYRPKETFICCLDCYDGAPDAGPQLTVCGSTLADAIKDWNGAQAEERECSWCGATIDAGGGFANRSGETFCSAHHRSASNAALRRLRAHVEASG